MLFYYISIYYDNFISTSISPLKEPFKGNLEFPRLKRASSLQARSSPCVPLILKSGSCLGCIREAGHHTCGVPSTASGRFGQAGRAFIFKAIAHDGTSEIDGIVAWTRHKEKEKLANRELAKLQTLDRRHQLKMAEVAAFDDNESLAKEAKLQAMDMFEAETGRLLQGIKPVADQDNTNVQVSPPNACIHKDK